jgi:hypothetical protein
VYSKDLTLKIGLALLWLAGTAAAPVDVRPSQTDPRITTFDQPHVCWMPHGDREDRHQLFLFLPGTGGKPKEHFAIGETAAGLGYHVIFLMYPDNLAAQIKCGNSKDPEAHMKFRLAILRGGQLGPHRSISRPDSIENRLEKLLVWLARTRPSEGWGEFVNDRGGIAWKKIAVSGASQGGGHACVIAKYHEVARVLCFASPKDYSFYFKRPAKGFDSQSATPLDRYFTFNHVRDNGNGCTHDQQMAILKQMGLTVLGVVDADHAGPEFEHGHVLLTNVDVPGNRFHGSVHSSQFAVCPKAWKYMLTEAAPYKPLAPSASDP